ncbi:MAG: penicillin-binding protein 1C [Spirochaetaceae bacterium]|nr:penicillin-binding protein 1C [Spirochaetaceae bacterium]
MAGIVILLFSFSLSTPLFKVPYSHVIYARNGELLGALVATDGQWRFPPQPVKDSRFAIAIIEYEDRRFRYHPGVDPIAIARAAVQNIREGRIVSGGSTITMQTIRLARGNRNRTFYEKIIEVILALRLELTHSKDDILALYVSNAPFGGNVVGLEAAAWRWFGRSTEELSWAEAATLAVLPNSPGLVHPGRNRDTLKQKRDSLLDRLAKRGFITEETRLLAKIEPLPQEPRPLPRQAPHLLARTFMEQQSQNRQRSFFHKRNDHARITTTIDYRIQERASVILNRWSSRFQGNGVMNAAAIILDTQTGEVLAYVGNVHSRIAGDVDIIPAPRSSGSLLKPFLYAAMLDSGELMPAGLVSDIPTRIGSYSPENNTRTFVGMIPADQALARSVNIPAVRKLRSFGVDRFARLLRSLGVSTLFRHGDDYGLPLILGGAEVTLWDMAGLYAGLARTATAEIESRDSKFFSPTYYPRVVKTEGRQNLTRVSPISPGAAYLTLDALTYVVRPGEEAAWQNFASARRIAWKTGTSFGFRDAWAIGTTSRWTVAVWVGNATGEGRAELRSTTTAAPVLFEIFSFLGSSEWFEKPFYDLKVAEVCFLSGFPAGGNCEAIRITSLPRNAPFHNPCPFCRTVTLNEAQDRQVVLTANTIERTITRRWFVMPPAEEWFFTRWNLDYRVLPPFEGVSARSTPLALFNPEENSQIYVPVEIDGRLGQVVFMAAHRDSNATIHWHLNEQFLGSTQVFHEMETRPATGVHLLSVVDNFGNTVQRRFRILSAAD